MRVIVVKIVKSLKLAEECMPWSCKANTNFYPQAFNVYVVSGPVLHYKWVDYQNY